MMQREPQELFELDPAVSDVRGAVMLHHLEGFMDAGAAGRLLVQHLLTSCEREGTVARFDVDRLIDYRSRRPPMTYCQDRWEGYEQPELSVRLLRDAAGARFLLLAGPEPDHEWELFAAAVRVIVDRLGVSRVVGFHGIPMGVPHTRPLGIIAHGTRPDELPGDRQKVPGRLQIPGSASALLELRLGAAGHDASGFAVHVPHYLAQTVYPAAALALLDAVTATTGLDLPAGDLREASQRTNAEIDRQVSDSAEIAELVGTLERQYDAYVAGGRDAAGSPGDGLLEAGDLPTADEIAAQFERFLAEQQGNGESPDH